MADPVSSSPFLNAASQGSETAPPRPAAAPLRPAVPPTDPTPLPPSTSPRPEAFQAPAARAGVSATERLLSNDLVLERRRKRRRMFLWVLVVLLLLGLCIFAYWYWQRTPAPDAPPSDPSTPPSSAVPAPVEPEAPVLEDDMANYRSENFKAGEIVFLGEAQFLQESDGVMPLTIDSIRGEAFTEKNKKEVKLVITWNTNKLATAEISYAKGIGQTPKVAQSEDYSYDHSLILTGLDPASTYLYTIKATDRFGSVVTSEPYAVFTGTRSVSLFDLIAGAIGDVFGWAVKE